ncbi:MAG: hypothetical protein ACK5KU_02985 [Beutenbergiaceae bacterium]
MSSVSMPSPGRGGPPSLPPPVAMASRSAPVAAAVLILLPILNVAVLVLLRDQGYPGSQPPPVDARAWTMIFLLLSAVVASVQILAAVIALFLVRKDVLAGPIILILVATSTAVVGALLALGITAAAPHTMINRLVMGGAGITIVGVSVWVIVAATQAIAQRDRRRQYQRLMGQAP